MSSNSTAIRLKWAGGLHTFRLHAEATGKPVSGLEARLHHSMGARVYGLHDGEHAILRRLVGGGWGQSDIELPIELGLRNGGSIGAFSPFDAAPKVSALMAQHVLNRPLAESVSLAQTVLMAAIYGVPAGLADTDRLTAEAFIAATAAAVQG